MLGATTHTRISKIWDKRFSLNRGTPTYFPCDSYGCSHHQYLFSFQITLRSSSLLSLATSSAGYRGSIEISWKKTPFRFAPSQLHRKVSFIQVQQKEARLIFLAPLTISVTFHPSPKPSRAPFGSLFIPNSSHVSGHGQHLLLPHFSFHLDKALQTQRLSHVVKLLSTSVKAFE